MKILISLFLIGNHHLDFSVNKEGNSKKEVFDTQIPAISCHGKSRSRKSV